MSPQADPGAEVKLQNRRRGERLNTRVPISIEWDKSDGSFSRQRAYTRVVNAYGCLLIAPQGFERDQRLRIVNLANFRSNQGVVVWKGKERTEGWELGVELVSPEMDFWGIQL